MRGGLEEYSIPRPALRVNGILDLALPLSTLRIPGRVPAPDLLFAERFIICASPSSGALCALRIEISERLLESRYPLPLPPLFFPFRRRFPQDDDFLNAGTDIGSTRRMRFDRVAINISYLALIVIRLSF